jgi:hypothetical protein
VVMTFLSEYAPLHLNTNFFRFNNFASILTNKNLLNHQIGYLVTLLPYYIYKILGKKYPYNLIVMLLNNV